MKLTPPPSVIITGASTGIGKACALYLDKQGYRVFAGCRKEEDAESLRKESSGRLVPIHLDVTNNADIDEVRRLLEESLGEGGLSALINNAGIALGGPQECISLDIWRRQFEVNVFGLIAMTRTMIPLLRPARGRIVNISSIAGRSSMPFTAPYCASKHAVEALSDSLRLELRPWGIKTILIEPGAIDTPIWEKAAGMRKQMDGESNREVMELYGSYLRKFYEVIENAAHRAAPVERVVDAVWHALTSDPPRERYVVGTDARMRLVLNLFPTRIQDWVIARMLKLSE